MNAAVVARFLDVDAPTRFAHVTRDAAGAASAVDVIVVCAARDRSVEMRNQTAATRRLHDIEAIDPGETSALA